MGIGDRAALGPPLLHLRRCRAHAAKGGQQLATNLDEQIHVLRSRRPLGVAQRVDPGKCLARGAERVRVEPRLVGGPGARIALGDVRLDGRNRPNELLRDLQRGARAEPGDVAGTARRQKCGHTKHACFPDRIAHVLRRRCALKGVEFQRWKCHALRVGTAPAARITKAPPPPSISRQSQSQIPIETPIAIPIRAPDPNSGSSVKSVGEFEGYYCGETVADRGIRRLAGGVRRT